MYNSVVCYNLHWFSVVLHEKSNHLPHQHFFFTRIPKKWTQKCIGYFCFGSSCSSYQCCLEQTPEGSVWAAGLWEPRGHLALREAPPDGFQTRPDTPAAVGSLAPSHNHSYKDILLHH